jgi:hypothetical protein
MGFRGWNDSAFCQRVRHNAFGQQLDQLVAGGKALGFAHVIRQHYLQDSPVVGGPKAARF